MISLEEFKKILVEIEFKYSDTTIYDAYNHLEKTEKGYRGNILGLRFWINETGEIYNQCRKYSILKDTLTYGLENSCSSRLC